MLTFFNVIMVFVGAAFGGIVRFSFSEFLKAKTTLPGWCAIFCANLLGSFIIGAAFGVLAQIPESHAHLTLNEISDKLGYALLITGFCGGLTTYSTFSLDNLFLYFEKKWAQLAFNMLASISLCTLAAWIGFVVFGDKPL